ncbi:MAG: hypothetical protein ACO3AA_05755, partial [Chitinophagaceae bacterium]
MKCSVRYVSSIILIGSTFACTAVKQFSAKYSPFTTRREVVEKGQGRREEVKGNTVDSSLLTVNSQQSSDNHQLSIVNSQPTITKDSTYNLQPTTYSPPTDNRQPSSANSQLLTVNRQPSTVNPQLKIVPREFRAAWIASVANINWP